MRNLSALVAVGLVGATFAGCGSSDNGGSTGDGASTGGAGGRTADVTFIADLTGPVGYAAEPMKEGIDFALAQAKKDGELKDIDVKVKVEDSASDPQQAVTLMSSAAKDDDVDATFQATGSGGALATAPIAERGKLPMLNVQSSADGIVESGEHVYLSGAPPQELTIPLQTEYWKEQGVKDIGLIYDSSVPTLKQFAEKEYPAEAKRLGMNIAKTSTISTDQTDFNSLATEMARANVQAIMVGGQGAQNARIITQLRQAGYKGLIGGTGGFAIGVQEPLGTEADGVTYPTDFSPAAPDAATKKFVAAYKAATGKDPVTFTAEGYDAARLLIEALKDTDGDITRESLQAGLQKVMASGFDSGAQGRITYVDRKARLKASLVKWGANDDTSVVSQKDLAGN
jgi:branched-chain amino acid transport system substrate-binding protein